MTPRSVVVAALATIAAAAVIGGLGAVLFETTPATAASSDPGITPVEAALGVSPKPVTLAMLTATSTGSLTEAVGVEGNDLKVDTGSISLLAPKALPRAKAKPMHKARRRVSPASHPGSGARVVRVAGKPAGISGGVSQSSKGASGAWRVAQCSTFGIGDGLIGSGLAGGGTLHSDSMIVAHKSLPFGTRIQFSYNGRTCVAVVGDRGPYVGGREFDLGPGTAKALGFDGVDYLRYRIIGR
jgi:rare lipoprotein A (peptidoglycan hydrolase)